jgi:hypothetical protein
LRLRMTCERDESGENADGEQPTSGHAMDNTPESETGHASDEPAK